MATVLVTSFPRSSQFLPEYRMQFPAASYSMVLTSRFEAGSRQIWVPTRDVLQNESQKMGIAPARHVLLSQAPQSWSMENSCGTLDFSALDRQTWGISSISVAKLQSSTVIWILSCAIKLLPCRDWRRTAFYGFLWVINSTIATDFFPWPKGHVWYCLPP